LEKTPEPPENPTAVEAMAHRLKTPEGRRGTTVLARPTPSAGDRFLAIPACSRAILKDSRGVETGPTDWVLTLAACRTEVWNFAAVLFFGCARSFFHLNGR